MSDPDRKSQNSRARAIARLAALQRLRDQAIAHERPSMLATIGQMIDDELAALNSRLDDHSTPQAHAPAPSGWDRRDATDSPDSRQNSTHPQQSGGDGSPGDSHGG